MAWPGAEGGGMLRVPRAGLILAIVGLLAFAVLGTSPSPVPAAAQVPPSAPGAPFAPDEVIIQFRPGVSDADKAAARSRANATRKELIAAAGGGGRGELELAGVPPGLAVAAAARSLESHPAVAFAQPNWIYTLDETSNDPYYTNDSLWGMYGDATSPANQYGSQAGEAWAAGYTGSGDVYVGVIDQGIQYTHPDLDANIWANPYDPPDGVDNDGNGYADDVHGWDFVGNDSVVYPNDPLFPTLESHATHVAGTIGAEGGNGTGVVGVNWRVKLISAKAFDVLGNGTTANIVKATNYITDLKTRHGLRIVATNNSWSGGAYDQALSDAITSAGAAGILYVAAAGNDGTDNDSTPRYPSSYRHDNIIAVAAIDSRGALASFSNYGATTVDLGAPGVGIWSTMPSNSYAGKDGTSMSTPHVTGAAALYAAAHPAESATQIKSALLGSALTTDSLSGKVVTGGRLCVSCALSGGSAPTATPTGTPTATPTATTGGATPTPTTTSGLPTATLTA